jgi:sugar fermentation stimulation protein A
MRGAYCLLAFLERDAEITIGRLGTHAFQKGIYAYVGSAQGGIDARVGRHMKRRKKLRWHIDYLLKKAEVLCVLATPASSKDIECRMAASLMRCEGAVIPVPRFGSSDCKCPSHLIYLGDGDIEWAAESVSMQLSLLDGAYVRRADELERQ